MSYPFIAFAESAFKDNCSWDPVSIIPEEYDHQFPPLTISKNPLTDGWQEIGYDDDTFSCNSTVWIGTPSYAEIATNAGVQHKPVFFNSKCHPKPWFHYTAIPLFVSQRPISQVRHSDKVYDEVNDEQFDLWSQSKFTGHRKRDIHQTVTIRKKKTYQMVYRQVAKPHVIAWKQEIYPKEQELIKARDYMKNVKLVIKDMDGLGGPKVPSFDQGKGS
ncbi:hypothetical protein BJV82DRAFT_624855 [Fennellomyces sp. T-0311]|nr:hypothetical protein BJV82DRAFT_624855 [Fennellomyces sp. T-0311]